ncbi:DsbA family protein [Agrococcus jejuensis]|uniref:Protein-disulfide isomerase n=1 Tax=Agrococcus jejuensis TaxID=399736 RepID=A0A1G8BAQ8_9MICO|nr:thioredoxin domain-containing protein [Agrococcus jejuensis]SDH30123.1 Protein-disulfide isomerase [Agrococcus jejuensis]
MRRLAAVVTASLAALVLAGCVVLPPAVAPVPSASDPAPVLAAGFPANMASHGVLQTDEGVASTSQAGPTPTPVAATDVGDRVHVVAYVDLLCPYCGLFFAANGRYLEDAVAAGDVALEIHPVSFLDGQSQGTQYSTRAANLVAAVASLHPEATPAVIRALFADQPGEQTTGHSDDELLAIAAEAGAQSEALTVAVTTIAFAPFVEASTDAATDTSLPGQTVPLTGTPTVIVDGQIVQDATDEATFEAAVEAARD